jgi:hypothetical protein
MQVKIMAKRVAKLAYDLDGNHVPYESGSAKFRLTIRGSSISSDRSGLPQMPSGLTDGIDYFPQPLADRIADDLQSRGVHPMMMAFLGMPENVARSYVKLVEWVSNGLPPASSGAYLSTRMNW